MRFLFSGNEQTATIIQTGTLVDGNISTLHNIRIDGEVKGTVSAGGRLIVGKTGTVGGGIQCDNAIIEGAVTGNVYVDAFLEVKSSAVIVGDICAEDADIKSGAKIEGNIKVKKVE